MIDGHACNVFCSGGHHTDLVRITPGLVDPERYLARWFADTHRVVVRRAWRVEAPPADAPLPPGWENRLEYGADAARATDAYGIEWDDDGAHD